MMSDSEALVALSRAEKALADASDILEILDLRTMGKAFEVIAIAQGYEELAQSIKIFQLKAERKAGLWLNNNLQWGGNSSSRHVTLKDLEISRMQSSRWQLIATVSDGEFNAWLDDRIQRDFEITAGGLREYARNLQGKPNPSYGGQIPLVPRGCALQGFIIRCSGELQGHHIINKGEVLGNKEGRAILAACPEEIMSRVCYAHNVGRLADSPAARKILLLQKIYEYGWIPMKEWFTIFLATFKQYRIDLELERLLS